MRHFEYATFESEPFDFAISGSVVQMIRHLSDCNADPSRRFCDAFEVLTSFDTMNGGPLALGRWFIGEYISGYSDDVICWLQFVDQLFFVIVCLFAIGIERDDFNFDFKAGVCLGCRSHKFGPRLIAPNGFKSPLQGSGTDINGLSPNRMLVDTKSSARLNAQLHQLHQDPSHIAEVQNPRKRGSLGPNFIIAVTYSIPSYHTKHIIPIIYSLSLSN